MKICHIAGTPIRIHWTLMALVAGLMTWQYAVADVTSMLIIGAAAIVLFATVFLHELAHVLVAKDFGYETDSITLYPFGGIARIMMPVRPPPEHELYIALAGPAVNAILTLLFLPLAWFYGDPFGLLALLNFIMFAFNMLPSYPMDGGRVMRSFLARVWEYDKATKFSIIISRGFAWLYFAGGVYLRSPLLVAIGAYLLYLLYYRINREVDDSK